ncbi:hypothetical protein BYT27DRAFT_6638691 [Phlegmacium glaucopus]|nr:hypothetical protein BYT27DRAFT_6638691 [Phlegmacium glaucopus]
MPSNKYTPLALNNEEDKPSESHPIPQSGNTISISKGILGLFLILTILNMILAAVSGYYSARMTKLLQEYEEKPLSSLPHIDPFNGQYRNPPVAGN